jgi:hypothetical protein
MRNSGFMSVSTELKARKRGFTEWSNKDAKGGFWDSI